MNRANIYLLYLTQQEEHIEHPTDYINNNKKTKTTNINY